MNTRREGAVAGGDDIVICEPVRTPVGRFLGALASLTAAELGSQTVLALLDRTGLSEEDVDDLVLGNGYPSGEDPAIGRVVALDAGLVGVPGVQLDRRCGSGLQAVMYAAGQVATGAARAVIAGGVESMSNVEHYARLRPGVRQGSVDLVDRLDRARIAAGGHNHPIAGGMIETAENLRREYGIDRAEQDALALTSHRRAVTAHESGSFDEEIVPITVPGPRGKGDVVMDRDEHPRPDLTLDSLSRLRPILGRSDPDATVTAGNASGQNDGAAMCVVTTRREADRLGLHAFVVLRSWAVAGVAPETMGIGPVPATHKALERAGLTLGDIGLIELNEAFAAQVLAVLRQWDIDVNDERLNPLGSGISLGHPIGATGARILATGSREAVRRGVPYFLQTLCIGGGQGIAAVFETIR
jgi:acetyl-CoA C-acetyltransferase